GLRAAAEWLLRQWKEEAWLVQADEAWAKDEGWREKRLADIQQVLAKEEAKARPQGDINGQGQTMEGIPGPVEVLMGSPPTEEGRFKSVESQHRRRIGRSFAIAAHPVTVGEYRLSNKGYSFTERYAPTPDCPAANIRWYQAAAYCNWLSGREGIPLNQWC